MYKPNFCAECGTRIERARWRPWTSGRFCEACDGRFRRGRVVRPLAACAVLLVAGFTAGRLVQPAPPPLLVERAQVHASVTPLQLLPAPMTKRAAATTDEDAAASATKLPHYGADGTADERPTEAGEVVSMCGARTKKGTPCSRRVRGTGRCWQHRGRAALLPPARLIVQGQ